MTHGRRPWVGTRLKGKSKAANCPHCVVGLILKPALKSSRVGNTCDVCGEDGPLILLGLIKLRIRRPLDTDSAGVQDVLAARRRVRRPGDPPKFRWSCGRVLTGRVKF